MEQLAADLWLLDGRPRHAFNVYLLGDVLVDSGTRHASKRILRQLAGRAPTAHALTHVHADHQGSSAAVCEALGLPLWVGAREAGAMSRGELAPLIPANAVTRWQLRRWAGPGHAVARALEPGDSVAGFEVLDTAGHSPGHISFWRESDRTLVLGDVLFGRHPLSGRPGLHEPPSLFTLDPRRNRAAIRRVAELEPALVCFGHGPPHRDAEALAAFAAGLDGR